MASWSEPNTTPNSRRMILGATVSMRRDATRMMVAACSSIAGIPVTDQELTQYVKAVRLHKDAERLAHTYQATNQ